jgi:hypothetical protein
VPDFDVTTPHIACIYDYWLGGKDNFEADREAAEMALAATPTILPGVTANRRFLGRAVRFMAVKVTFRTRGAVEEFFAGHTGLVDPGVVPVEEWRPTSDLDFNSLPTAMWGGVGVRR